MRRVWNGVPIALLMMAVLLPAAAPAADTAPRVVAAGREFRIVGPKAVTDDAEAAVAYASGTNEYLVVWRDGRNETTRAADIYARRVAAAGTRPAREERISGPQALGEDSLPAVAYNPDTNEYLVVWQDLRNDPTRGHDIYGRPISATGSPLGGDLRISGTRLLSGLA